MHPGVPLATEKQNEYRAPVRLLETRNLERGEEEAYRKREDHAGDSFSRDDFSARGACARRTSTAGVPMPTRRRPSASLYFLQSASNWTRSTMKTLDGVCKEPHVSQPRLV